MVSHCGFSRTAPVEELSLGTWTLQDEPSPGLNFPAEEIVLGRRVQWNAENRLVGIVQARTELTDAIGQALRAVSPQDAINVFAGCGYSII